MKSKLIYTLLIVGIIATSNLVLGEIAQEGTCPKLGVIPACYLVFLSFLIPLVVHISQGFTLSEALTKNV